MGTEGEGLFRAIAKFGMRPIQPSEVEALVRSAPPGSLVRVDWVDELESDELDPGIPLDRNGSAGEVVVITRYLPSPAFHCLDEGPAVVEFECLWRGRLMTSTSSSITAIVSKAAP